MTWKVTIIFPRYNIECIYIFDTQVDKLNTTAITDDIMEWNKYEIDDYPVCIVHYPKKITTSNV
jgi:hypothetical protein